MFIETYTIYVTDMCAMPILFLQIVLYPNQIPQQIRTIFLP